MRKYLILLSIFAIVLSSCDGERVFTPKPRMYPRVDYPTHAYEQFQSDVCNFTFLKPVYSEVDSDVDFFGEKKSDLCWFDLNIKQLNSTIHFSYNKIEGENTLQKLVDDSFQLVEKHNVKAEYRAESPVDNQYGVQGFRFDIDGPVASPINFFLTDTTQHFVRASLYFNDAVYPDSIAPVLDFVSQDVAKILETFRWKE